MTGSSKKLIFGVAWDNDGLYPETEKPYVYDLRNNERIFQFRSVQDGEIEGMEKAFKLAKNLNNWWLNYSNEK